MALSVLQKTIDSFASDHQGFNLDDHALVYKRGWAKGTLLREDERNLIEDGYLAICKALYGALPVTMLDYPILYRVTAAGNLIVGIDERDLHEGDDDPSDWDTPELS